MTTLRISSTAAAPCSTPPAATNSARWRARKRPQRPASCWGWTGSSPSAATARSAVWWSWPSRASLSSASRRPSTTISSARITRSATTPPPIRPWRPSIVCVTRCSPTSAAPWLRSWAATRAIWRSMSVWLRARRLFWCRKSRSILTGTSSTGSARRVWPATRTS